MPRHLTSCPQIEKLTEMIKAWLISLNVWGFSSAQVAEKHRLQMFPWRPRTNKNRGEDGESLSQKNRGWGR